MMAVNSTPYPIHVGSYPVYNQMRTEDLILCAEQKGAEVIALKVYDLQGKSLAKARTSLTALRMNDMNEAVRGMDLINVFSIAFPYIVKIPKPPDGNAPLPEDTKKQVANLIDKAIDDISERIIRDEVDPPNGTICPVTTELMHQPVTPNQCGHSFDVSTILDLLKCAGEKGEKARCPECRTDFDGFKTNVGLARTIDAFLADQKKKIVPQIHCVDENPEIAEIHIKQAKQHIKDGNYQKAETSFKKALENTKDRSVYNEIPELYLKMNAPMKAALSYFYCMKYDTHLTTTPIKLINQIWKFHPLKVSSPHLDQLLILVFPLTGRNEEASNFLSNIARNWLEEDQPNITNVKKCFQTALKLNPKNFPLYQELGEIEEDDETKLQILMRKACHLAKEKKSSEAYHVAVDAFDYDARYIDSRFMCELMMRPTSRRSLISSYLSEFDGSTLKEKMKFAKFETSMFLNRTSDENVVDLYIKRHQYSKGVQWVERLAKERIGQKDFENAERILLYAKKYFGSTMNLLQILHHLYSNHIVKPKMQASICHKLGQALLQKGRLADAEQYLQKAYTLDPSYTVGMQLAESLAGQKKIAECVKQHFDVLGILAFDGDPTGMSGWLKSLQRVDPLLSHLTTDQKMQVYMLKQNQTLTEKIEKNAKVLREKGEEISDLVGRLASTEEVIRAIQEESIPTDRGDALKRLQDHPQLILVYPKKWRLNDRFILEALEMNASIFKYIPEDKRGNYRIAQDAIKRDFQNLKFAPFEICDDKEIILSAVKIDGSAFQYASTKMKDDKKIVMAAIDRSTSAAHFASDRLRKDLDLALYTITNPSNYTRAADMFTEEVWDKEEFIRYFKSRNVSNKSWFKYPYPIRANKEAILRIIQKAEPPCGSNPSEFDFDEAEAKSIKILGDLYCRNIPKHLLNDKDFVIEACQANPFIFIFCPPHIQMDLEVIDSVPEIYLEEMPLELRNHRDIVMKAVSQNGYRLEYASESMKKDQEVVLKAVSRNHRAFQYAAKELKDDEEFVILAYEKTQSSLLAYVSPRLQDKRSLVMKSVRREGCALEHASGRLKDDEQVVLAAMYQNQCAYRFASLSLKKKQLIALSALHRGENIDFIPEELFNDKHFLLEVVGITPHILKIAPYDYVNDYQFMLIATTKNPLAIQYGTENIRNNEGIIDKVLQADGTCLKYASDRLRDDQSFVKYAVEKSWHAFQYASDRLRNDKRFVSTLCRINKHIIRYASEELRTDKKFMINCLRCDASLDDVSEKIQNDPEVIAAAKHNRPDINFLK